MIKFYWGEAMKTYNGIITKIIGFILTSFISLVFIFEIFFNDTNVVTLNEYQTKKIDYETIYVYNDKVPSNISKVLNSGEDGLAIVSDNNEDIIKEMIPEIIEQGSGLQGLYYGYLTGYGADCEGCTGIYYCKTREGTWLNAYKDGYYYEDSEFGSVRILAAAVKQFPCGTVIKITDNKHDVFTGIVLDTGSAMRSAYNKGKVHIDVAFPLEHSAGIGTYTDFSGTVKFEVQRWGW